MTLSADPPAPLLRLWQRKKVLTLAEILQRLDRSVRTVRRHLHAWKCLASFNQNGRFYTLPAIPQFDPQGLWFHGDIGFSAHGHLPQTLVALVAQAPAGLTAAELGQRLRLDPRSFLWQFHQHPGLQRQKHQGRFVYLAAQPRQAKAQLARRAKPEVTPALPAPAEAVEILVRAIQHPGWSPERLSRALRTSHPHLTADTVRSLFAHHGLTLKKTPRSTG
jgi:methylphosphotriester-DNA--protein-cysteine methyltransferase